MRTRLNRFLVLTLFGAAIIVWPASSSAQLLDLDACEAAATLDTIYPEPLEITATAKATERRRYA